jgi:hypothetical protein
VAEEPVAEEPVAEEPVAEEPVAEEPGPNDRSSPPISVVPRQGESSDVERLAARRLGVADAAIVETAIELWGRSLAAERDDRAKERGRRGATSSTGRAARGHVTRTLIEELRVALRGHLPVESPGDDPVPDVGRHPVCHVPDVDREGT